MAKARLSEVILIRHGATDRPGHLCGRTDVGMAEAPAMPEKSVMRDVGAVVASPARRAVETAVALWPGRSVQRDARLWEQDFGAWDGLAYADVPDVGALSRAELAAFAAPGGESFADVVARAEPALRDAGELAAREGNVVVVAHAGVIRAALALAIGDIPGGLAFEIDHLSVTRLRWSAGHGFSVRSVNGTLGDAR